MKIRVDAERCEGHNRCYAVAPDLFEVDDYGQATALNDGVIAEGDKDAAMLAVDNCPEHAVEVVEP